MNKSKCFARFDEQNTGMLHWFSTLRTSKLIIRFLHVFLIFYFVFWNFCGNYECSLKKIMESLIMPNSTILFKSIVNFFSSTQCVICLKDRNKLCFDLKIFFINVIWKCVIKNSPIIKINIEHYKQNTFNIIHNLKMGNLIS